ncbi:MAG: hypothetical protein U0232_03020 [Thermomicrobiales bacterium]
MIGDDGSGDAGNAAWLGAAIGGRLGAQGTLVRACPELRHLLNLAPESAAEWRDEALAQVDAARSPRGQTNSRRRSAHVRLPASQLTIPPTSCWNCRRPRWTGAAPLWGAVAWGPGSGCASTPRRTCSTPRIIRCWSVRAAPSMQTAGADSGRDAAPPL